MSDWKNLLWDATCSFCCLCHHCARPPCTPSNPSPHLPTLSITTLIRFLACCWIKSSYSRFVWQELSVQYASVCGGLDLEEGSLFQPIVFQWLLVLQIFWLSHICKDNAHIKCLRGMDVKKAHCSKWYTSADTNLHSLKNHRVFLSRSTPSTHWNGLIGGSQKRLIVPTDRFPGWQTSAWHRLFRPSCSHHLHLVAKLFC